VIITVWMSKILTNRFEKFNLRKKIKTEEEARGMLELIGILHTA